MTWQANSSWGKGSREMSREEGVGGGGAAAAAAVAGTEAVASGKSKINGSEESWEAGKLE